MSKSDFNIEEPDYYAPEEKDETQENKLEPQTNQTNDLYHQDYGENSDFSNIGIDPQGSFIDNADVVFEEKTNLTTEEKVKDFLSTLNKKLLIVIGAVILLLIMMIVLITSYFTKSNAAYTAEILVPNIVYMGETGNISVIAKGKKDLENTVTTFESKNPEIITLFEEKMTGQDVLNIIIPVQEGRTTITVESKLGNKKLGKEEKEIVVCPAFTSDLLLTKNISLIENSSYDLIADFGEEECSKDIIYESSNPEIMTVNSEGKVTGVKSGTAILMLKKGARTISVNVTVTKQSIDMTSFKVEPSKIQLKPGENIRIKTSYFPLNATTRKMSFISNNDNIAKVSESGLITAVDTGTTIIKVRPIVGYFGSEIEVIVSEEVSNEGSEVTEMKLNKSSVTLVQGESEKVIATVTPDNAKNKTITWKSSNTSIATVTKNGVVYAKKAGTVNITASTSNNISKTVRVTVTEMKAPVIKASDNIASNQWHNKPYVLNFSGSENGVVYHYGKTEEQMTDKGIKVTISNDEKATYYVKACKDNICSKTVSYISKLDTTKPQVLTVAGIENSVVSEDSVQIALKDITSMIQKWCVTTVDNASTCKWKTIKSMANPVVTYTAKYNDIYYVFAKDTAGNISDSYTFEITNIE